MTPRTTRILAGLTLLTACGETPTALDRPAAGPPLPVLAASYDLSKYDLTNTLSVGGRFAESSYMACIASLQAQGLPYKQILAECATQLSWQGEHGWGAEGQGFTLPGNASEAFDPSSITSSCGSGDSRLAAGAQQVTRTNPFDRKTQDAFGQYSWGGAGVCAGDVCARGLSKEESKALKDAAIEEYYAAEKELRDAAEALLKDPENPVKRENFEIAKRAAEEAKKKADADPNLKPAPEKSEPAPAPAPQSVSESSDDASTCAQVLQAARELLAECHRTGWKSTECQQLHAKMNGCPDPTLIYVDPESGYACAPPVDPQLVIDAWTRMCERNVTPGPDGGSPCSKPNPGEGGRILYGDERDVCTSPIAYVDPEQAGCFAPLEVDDFGQPDVNGLIVWGQGVFGGPIVVLPQVGPSPFPFPPPRS